MARPLPTRQSDRPIRPFDLVHAQPARKGTLWRRRGRLIRFRAGDVLRAGLVLLLLGTAAYVLARLHEVVFLLLLAILLATAIDPLVNSLRRGPFNRGFGVLVVYSAIVAAIALPTAILAPSVATQGTAFMDTLPQRIEELRPHVQELQPAPLGQALANGIDRLGTEVRALRTPPEEKLVEVGAATLHSLLAVPVAGAAQVVVVHVLRVEQPGQAEPHHKVASGK
jgi:predicted PurR-regulated permease PerM